MPLPPVDPAEATLAVVGADVFWTPGRLRLTVEHRERAAGLTASIRKEIRRFLARGEPEKEQTPPGFRYKEALDRLTQRLDVPHLEDKVMGFGNLDEASAFVMAADKAMKYLSGILPTKAIQTVLGPQSVTPSDTHVARFRRAYAVAQDPVAAVLGNLQEGILARDESLAMESIYPSIYDAARQILAFEIVELKAARPRLEFPIWKTRMLEALLRTRFWNPALAKKAQAAYTVDDRKPERNQPLSSKLGDAEKSPIQRAVER